MKNIDSNSSVWQDKKVIASKTIALDESMAAFQPQVEKTGNLTPLSHIQWKTTDLGAESKVGANNLKIWWFLHLEDHNGS